VAIYQETKRVAHPEEVFPGVPDWRMDIAPTGPEAPHLTPEATHFLVELMPKVNEYFDHIACAMAPGERDKYFTVHTTAPIAKQLVHKTAEAVYDATRTLPNSHLVFFPAGAIPIAKIIQKMGYPSDCMHALDISGSKGTESGSSTIKSYRAPRAVKSRRPS
jgi:hypothetical protein